MIESCCRALGKLKERFAAAFCMGCSVKQQIISKCYLHIPETQRVVSYPAYIKQGGKEIYNMYKNRASFLCQVMRLTFEKSRAPYYTKEEQRGLEPEEV